MMFQKQLITFVSLMASSFSYESGAPTETCVSLIPKHGVSFQTSPNPYVITVSKNALTLGETLEITIQGINPADTIVGFIVQARIADSPVGIFNVRTDDFNGKLLDCGGLNTVTHYNKNPKQSIRFTWTPTVQGLIQFKGTILKGGFEFWFVQSETVQVY